jgi:hypothetical protein
VALDVADYLLLADVAKIVVSDGANLVQEPADDERSTSGPSRALSRIGIESVENPIVRGKRRQYRRRDCARLAQYRQPSLQRRSVARLDGLLPGPIPEVLFDCALIKIGLRAATTSDPTQKSADHIETSPSAVANKTVSRETCYVALDKRTVRPAPETSEQSASTQIILGFHLLVLRY